MEGVTAEGGATGVVINEAAPGAAIKAGIGGVTAITVDDTDDTAAVETGATPDGANLTNVSAGY